MLVGISPLMSPELLSTLYRMGHGDEIVLADAHFPGERMGRPVIRADGLKIADLLVAIMPLIMLDQYDDKSLIMMAAVEGHELDLDPAVEASYRATIEKYHPDAPAVHRLERFAFYERAKTAIAIVITGDTAKYGNLILKKGITPV